MIIRRYEAGEDMKAIAEDLGIDRKTVYNVARRAGLPNRHVFDPARRKRILTAYRAGVPIVDIADREGVNRNHVSSLAKRAGMPPRSGWRRKHPIDEHAFDELDGVGWWLIGLIAADGSLGPWNLISLTQREADVDVLHAFLEYTGCPGRPLTELRLSPAARTRAYPRSRAYEARIHSRRIRRVLEGHGITPRKSKTLRLGSQAAAQPAVWLGLLDGDGSVALRGARRTRRVIDFYGTPALMRQCSDFWGQRLTFQRVPKPTVLDHTGGLRHVALHGASATQAARIMLASSPTSLKRKRRTLQAIAAFDSERSR